MVQGNWKEILGKLGLGLAADEVGFELGIRFATSCLIWLSIFQALWRDACLVLPYAKTFGSPHDDQGSDD